MVKECSRLISIALKEVCFDRKATAGTAAAKYFK
jgi:hypothetical protein